MKSFYYLPVLAILAGCSSGEKTYDLSEHFAIGDKWTMKMSMHEDITGTYMSGVEGGEHNDMTLWWETEVMDVDSSGVTTSQTRYTRMAMNGWDSGDTSSVDTMGYAGMMGPMMAITMTTKSDKWGHVMEVTGAEGSMSMGNPKVDDNMVTANMIEMNTKWRPESEVAVGDTWEVDHVARYGYPMKYHNHYTLREVKDNVAYIDVESTMSPNPDDPTWWGATKLTQSLTGTQKGTIEVNLQTGWAMKTSFEQSFSGTYDMEIDTAVAAIMAKQMEAMMASMPMPESGEQPAAGMESPMPMEPLRNQQMSATVSYTYEVTKR